MTTIGHYTRATLAALALSLATLSAMGPSHVVALQAPAAEPSALEPKWVVSTGGLLFCIFVLIRLLNDQKSERKEDRAAFNAERKQHREELVALSTELKHALRDVAATNQQQALASQQNTNAIHTNTKATERLANEVRVLADRRREDRE